MEHSLADHTSFFLFFHTALSAALDQEYKMGVGVGVGSFVYNILRIKVSDNISNFNLNVRICSIM